MTEHLVLDTTFNAALSTAREINDCMNAGMNAYLWWYIRRYYGPINDKGDVTKRGFMMSQYARFIRPGSTKIHSTTNPQNNIYVTAYKNSTKVVIVAINWDYKSITQTFSLLNGTVTGFTPYVTSETKNCIKENNINVSNSSFTFTLEEGSVTTFVSE
jgi:glucuronoarabinoxylan endo-1,4-beta-xylanase